MQKSVSLIVGESVTKPVKLIKDVEDLVKLCDGQVVKTDQDFTFGQNHWMILTSVPEEQLTNDKLQKNLNYGLEQLTKMHGLSVKKISYF